MNEIVKIDHEEFGLEEMKAQQIAAQFKPMLDKMVELEVEANKVLKMDPSKKESQDAAREIRLKYVKVRTGTAAIHKEQKSFYLAAGKYIDGWKNAQVFASEGVEGKLKQIEDYEKIKAEEARLKLIEERSKVLAEYEIDPSQVDCGNMSEDVWGNYLIGVKAAYKHKKEAEAKAEADRIEKERIDKLISDHRLELAPYQDFIEDFEESVKLEGKEYQTVFLNAKKAKDDHDKKQKEIQAENERLKKEAEAKKKAEEEAEKKRREAEARAKEEAEKRAAKEKAEHEAALEKERQEKAKIQAELQKEKERQEKEKAEKEAAIQSELSKGDADKVFDLIADLNSLKTKYQFESDKNKAMYNGVGSLLDKIVGYIEKQEL